MTKSRIRARRENEEVKEAKHVGKHMTDSVEMCERRPNIVAAIPQAKAMIWMMRV